MSYRVSIQHEEIAKSYNYLVGDSEFTIDVSFLVLKLFL